MSGELNCKACGGQMALDCWGCNYHDMAEGIEEAGKLGAAVAFGLMGMAEAIRAAHPVVLRDADWHLEEDERGF